jgi:hypothetical protein
VHERCFLHEFRARSHRGPRAERTG